MKHLKQMALPFLLTILFALLMTFIGYSQNPNEVTPAAVEKATIPTQKLEVAKVTAVSDGDTYYIARQSGRQWIGLYGVECPKERSGFIKKSQPYSKQASDAVRQILKGNSIAIDSINFDLRGRMICKVYVGIDSTHWLDFSAFLVESGLAWAIKDSLTPEEYKRLHEVQENAKDSKLGLWALPGRKLLPSTWRKRYSIRK